MYGNNLGNKDLLCQLVVSHSELMVMNPCLVRALKRKAICMNYYNLNYGCFYL